MDTGLRDDWKKYLSKEDGRKNFQLDLGVLLMEFGIRYDWDNVMNESERPDWMRQKPLRPCECDFCFFCKQGLTYGIFHARGKKRVNKRKAVTISYFRKRKKVCSGLRESFVFSRYCGSCYRAQDINLTTEERKKLLERKEMEREVIQ